MQKWCKRNSANFVIFSSNLSSKVRGMLSDISFEQRTFFGEISPRNENWWRKVSLQSLVFKISLRTDNSLLRVIKFVYSSCKQHEIWNILKRISNLFQSPKTHHVRFWARSVDDKGNRVNCPKYLTQIPIMIHVLGWNYLPDESRYFAHQLQFPDV